MKTETNCQYGNPVRDVQNYEDEPIIEIELDAKECNTIIAGLVREFRSCVNELAEYVTFEEDGERENLEMTIDLGMLILKMVDLRDAPGGYHGMSTAEFLKILKTYRGKIPKQTLQTLRGQALAGKVDEAMRGLTQINRKNTELIFDTAVDLFPI